MLQLDQLANFKTFSQFMILVRGICISTVSDNDNFHSDGFYNVFWKLLLLFVLTYRFFERTLFLDQALAEPKGAKRC